MSWLNLNESLNSIKGQISNFASGVLAEGIVNDSDPFTELSVANQKIQELQNLCASQDVEIASLRRQNAEFYEKIALDSKSVESSTGSNGENWFWDPPSSDVNETSKEQAQRKNSTNSTISDLTLRITDLETEKKDLIQSLEQLDSDCQRTTDKLVTLKDNLQTDYNNLKTDYDSLKNENALLTKLNEKCKSDLNNHVAEIEKLKLLIAQLNSSVAESKQKNSISTVQNNETNNSEQHSPELKRQYDALKSKFNSLLEEKNMLDQTYELSKSAFSKMQTDYEKVNADFEHYKTDTISLEKYSNLAADYETLQKQYSEYELKSKTSTDKIEELSNKLQEIKLNKPAVSQSNLSDDHKKLQDMYNELKTKHEELTSDRLEMHKKYVNILTDTVKKYVDYLIPDEFTQKPNENAEFSEFNSKVEAVLKLLLDFKWKTETLERKLCEISNEKSVAISEKNHEIEKLLHNSEILSQEVITKTQTIKHYEMECSELIKNNDLLIAELQQYKNNNGLQTISESNEDNLLLLETQLENANKRIRELEVAINEMENAKQDVALETQTELDYIKKQLNMTGKELSQSKKEYQELCKTFKHYETENLNLSEEISKLKTAYNLCLNEKQNLELHVDKMKTEIENSEYKFTEANVDLETSREELATVKKENADIILSSQIFQSHNKELENKIVLLHKDVESLKSELQTTVDIRNQMEHQARNLTEKLQSSKMSETGLKFQNDTIKRELEIIEQKLSLAFQQLKTSSLVKDTSLDNENLSVVQKIDLLKRYLETVVHGVEQQNQQINEKESSSKQVIVLEHQISELHNQNSELLSIKQMLESNISDIQKKLSLLETEKLEAEEKFQMVTNEKVELEKNTSQQMALSNEVQNLIAQLEQACVVNNEMSARIGQLEAEVNSLNISKAELVNLVTGKHQENVQYHTEIQRLNQIIAVETEKCKNLEQQLSNLSSVDHSATLQQQTFELEKLTDQNNFLKEKCEKLAQNLLDEQANSQKILAERHTASDKEQALTKELERLRLHLVEIEDSYTKELLLAEQKNQEMLAKMNEIEQRERDSSTIYTSVNIRANQQVETLQNQLQLVTAQRDSFQNKISDAEDKINKQTAALTNLQCVLEQFQKDREKDIVNETERIRRQVNVEKQRQNELQIEISTLKVQLEESKQGLQAAARLTEQMEKSKQQVVTMKDEVTKLQDQLTKTEAKYKTLLNQTDAKVDKTLIRNLVVGFISANSSLNKDQSQMLKIIGTVLDFSQQDNDKLNLHKQQGGSWLSSILHPQAINTNSSMSQQSLSEAFVRFLESESQPKQAPPPLMNVRKMSTESNASTSSTSTTRQTPLLLNDVVLPTFADFAQNRNSSSILKDVLKEN